MDALEEEPQRPLPRRRTLPAPLADACAALAVRARVRRKRRTRLRNDAYQIRIPKVSLRREGYNVIVTLTEKNDVTDREREHPPPFSHETP